MYMYYDPVCFQHSAFTCYSIVFSLFLPYIDRLF